MGIEVDVTTLCIRMQKHRPVRCKATFYGLISCCSQKCVSPKTHVLDSGWAS